MDDEYESGLRRLGEAMAHKDWVSHCRRTRPTFSAATTYLAQFLAHDMTFSAVEALNFSKSGTLVRETQNLRSAPLRLETLYGRGLRQGQNLFEGHGARGRAQSIKFALNSFEALTIRPVKTVWAPKFSIAIDTVSRKTSVFGAETLKATPCLGDKRNADHPMILFIAVAFMQLHNYFVSQFQNGTSILRFEAARILVTHVWHAIIKNDILEPLRPFENSGSTIEATKIEGPDPIHGVMRALHALPLGKYHLHLRAPNTPTVQQLRDLLDEGAVTFSIKPPVEIESLTSALRGWWGNWGVDYNDFLDLQENQTNVMPVLPMALMSDGLFEKDLIAAGNHGVSGTSLYASLVQGGETFYHDITSVTGLTGFPAPGDLPLSLAFLIEAYNSNGPSGGLGPVGYELFSRRIESALSKAELDPDLSPLTSAINRLLEKAPLTFRDLIKLINSKPEEVNA